MYLKNALILESGPLKDLELEFEFTNDGLPKPTLIVGKNGSGKSNFLSYITDALVETAAKKFSDVAPNRLAGGHVWHRLVGGLTIRSGSEYEAAFLNFSDNNYSFVYASKGGKLDKGQIQNRLNAFPGVPDWPVEGSHKSVTGPDYRIEPMFRNDCYVSFQSNRGEKPYWSTVEDTPEEAIFENRLQNLLRKPITVHSWNSDIKPWLVDLLLDYLIDVGSLVQNPQGLQQAVVAAAQNITPLHNVNTLLQHILDVPAARLIRSGRGGGTRKLSVLDGQQPLLPSLDSFSSGQSMLFGIFCTILRYGDAAGVPKHTQQIEGIVVVDEIDAHLHADLLHDKLPKLMQLFPKVQFIVTTHAPLLPLGMEEVFGVDGFSLVELPTGNKISPERFSEFQASFQYMKDTKSFDEEVTRKASELERPLVLCEGHTDPKYFRTAAQLLGFERIAENVDFDWIGVMSGGQAKDGGEGQLKQARKTLQNNPQFLKAHTILLFDCDVQNVPQLDDGLLHVRVLDQNEENQRCNKGIENLLPADALEDEFFATTTHQNGATVVQTTTLDKNSLCDHLCDQKRDPADFESFRTALEVIEATLFPTSDEDAEAVED